MYFLSWRTERTRSHPCRNGVLQCPLLAISRHPEGSSRTSALPPKADIRTRKNPSGVFWMRIHPQNPLTRDGGSRDQGLNQIFPSGNRLRPIVDRLPFGASFFGILRVKLRAGSQNSDLSVRILRWRSLGRGLISAPLTNVCLPPKSGHK